MTDKEEEDFGIIRNPEEGQCVCGKRMRKVSVHLNYIVWKCAFCGRRRVRMKGARPFELKSDRDKNGKLDVAKVSLFDDILTVLEEEEKDNGN